MNTVPYRVPVNSRRAALVLALALPLLLSVAAYAAPAGQRILDLRGDYLPISELRIEAPADWQNRYPVAFERLTRIAARYPAAGRQVRFVTASAAGAQAEFSTLTTFVAASFQMPGEIWKQEAAIRNISAFCGG